MALLDILAFPDPRLRIKSSPIATVNARIKQLADDMLETMYAAPGVGLAANQVNIQKRMVVIDITEDKSSPLVLINPEITALEGETTSEEGCLSVPGYWEPVIRAEKIQVQALGKDGKAFSMGADGFLAICIQHEVDHLDGKLFVDYISKAKRQMIRKKLIKQQKQH